MCGWGGMAKPDEERASTLAVDDRVDATGGDRKSKALYRALTSFDFKELHRVRKTKTWKSFGHS